VQFAVVKNTRALIHAVERKALRPPKDGQAGDQTRGRRRQVQWREAEDRGDFGVDGETGSRVTPHAWGCWGAQQQHGGGERSTGIDDAAAIGMAWLPWLPWLSWPSWPSWPSRANRRGRSVDGRGRSQSKSRVSTTPDADGTRPVWPSIHLHLHLALLAHLAHLKATTHAGVRCMHPSRRPAARSL